MRNVLIYLNLFDTEMFHRERKMLESLALYSTDIIVTYEQKKETPPKNGVLMMCPIYKDVKPADIKTGNNFEKALFTPKKDGKSITQELVLALPTEMPSIITLVTEDLMGEGIPAYYYLNLLGFTAKILNVKKIEDSIAYKYAQGAEMLITAQKQKDSFMHTYHELDNIIAESLPITCSSPEDLCRRLLTLEDYFNVRIAADYGDADFPKTYYLNRCGSEILLVEKGESS